MKKTIALDVLPPGDIGKLDILESQLLAMNERLLRLQETVSMLCNHRHDANGGVVIPIADARERVVKFASEAGQLRVELTRAGKLITALRAELPPKDDAPPPPERPADEVRPETPSPGA